jgi:hypothetical protein
VIDPATSGRFLRMPLPREMSRRHCIVAIYLKVSLEYINTTMSYTNDFQTVCYGTSTTCSLSFLMMEFGMTVYRIDPMFDTTTVDRTVRRCSGTSWYLYSYCKNTQRLKLAHNYRSAGVLEFSDCVCRFCKITTQADIAFLEDPHQDKLYDDFVLKYVYLYNYTQVHSNLKCSVFFPYSRTDLKRCL